MNDLDRRLRDAGQLPVPPPDPAFATRLERRLRAGVLAPEPALRPAPRPAHRAWFPAAAVAAALAMVLGAMAVLRDGGEDVVRVASATDTVVVLPDGTVGPATPGLELPEGSRLQTGNEGHVVAGETELGPKQEAKVRKGTVKPSPTTVPPKPSEPSNPEAAAPTATTVPPVKPTTPPSTRLTPTTKPPVVVTPTTKPDPRPTDTKPTTTSTSGPTNTVAALKLDARYKETTVKLQWSAYTGKDFAAYLVLRADGPGEPRYPVDNATTVVARITDPWATSFMETMTDPAGRTYRVVAVDGERRLIARSPAVRPQPLA
jgi:outer membrane biosynthesis protein TonB